MMLYVLLFLLPKSTSVLQRSKTKNEIEGGSRNQAVGAILFPPYLPNAPFRLEGRRRGEKSQESFTPTSFTSSAKKERRRREEEEKEEEWMDLPALLRCNIVLTRFIGGLQKKKNLNLPPPLLQKKKIKIGCRQILLPFSPSLSRLVAS